MNTKGKGLRSLRPRDVALLAGSAVVIVFLAWMLMAGLGRLLRSPAPDETPDAAAPPPPPPETAPAVPRIKATLFFASEDGQRLVPTEREVALGEGIVAQARSILEAQLTAEAPAPLVSTIPKGTALRGIFVSQRNEVFVDLEPSIRTAHPGGSFQELMTVYTIVNALLTNLPTLQEVQILIGGQEVDTLAGHVDLRRPLRKNEGLMSPP
ncbi:MAG: GerMN domain-containing protein [Acidobacteriota bacterium]|nr:GerMN domain-containing protein [Acidobacteriota bacterium]